MKRNFHVEGPQVSQSFFGDAAKYASAQPRTTHAYLVNTNGVRQVVTIHIDRQYVGISTSIAQLLTDVKDVEFIGEVFGAGHHFSVEETHKAAAIVQPAEPVEIVVHAELDLLANDGRHGLRNENPQAVAEGLALYNRKLRGYQAHQLYPYVFAWQARHRGR